MGPDIGDVVQPLTSLCPKQQPLVQQQREFPASQGPLLPGSPLQSIVSRHAGPELSAGGRSGSGPYEELPYLPPVFCFLAYLLA